MPNFWRQLLWVVTCPRGSEHTVVVRATPSVIVQDRISRFPHYKVLGVFAHHLWAPVSTSLQSLRLEVLASTSESLSCSCCSMIHACGYFVRSVLAAGKLTGCALLTASQPLDSCTLRGTALARKMSVTVSHVVSQGVLNVHPTVYTV